MEGWKGGSVLVLFTLSPLHPFTLLQEPLRKLLKTLITVFRRLLSDRFDVLSERGIAPVIARRLLGIAGHAVARGFE